MAYQPNNNSTIFANSFFNIINAFKYVVLFMLYVVAFYYSFIKNTIPISFLLLLILHIFILGLTISDSNKLTLFKFDEIDNLPFPIINTLFKYLIYTGPVISWILLLISLSFIVHIFSRLNYYYNKSGDSLYLDETENNDFTILKTLLISSYIIIIILYGTSLNSVTTTNVSLQQVQMGSLVNRLFMTSILLFSFLLYFRLISVKNYTFFWIIISFIILLYAFNCIFDFQKGKLFRNFKLIYIGCFIGLLTIIGSLLSFVFYKNYDSLIALIPLLVWFIYVIYMGICLFNNNLFNVNLSYIIILLITVLCILSSLSVYYGIKLNKEL